MASNENVLVDLTIGGKPVKALVHFDRNGFGYTVDRTNGKVLVAEPFGPVNWASKIDLSTGSRFATRSTGRPPRRTPRVSAPPQSDSRINSRPRTRRRPSSSTSHEQHLHGLRGRRGEVLRPVSRTSARSCACTRARAVTVAGFIRVGSDHRQGEMGSQGEPGGIRRRAGDGLGHRVLTARWKAGSRRSMRPPARLLWKFKTPSGIIGNPMTYLGARRQAVRRRALRSGRLGGRRCRARHRPRGSDRRTRRDRCLRRLHQHQQRGRHTARVRVCKQSKGNTNRSR